MRPFCRVACALLVLTIGIFPGRSVSGAQIPIETKTLLEEQLERLPEASLCWDVRHGSLAPGGVSPAAGYHVHGWVVAYVFDGIERVEYEDGRVGTIEPGQAVLFEADTPHRHVSIGGVPRANVGFELTCQPQPNAVGNTGVLPGLVAGAGPYRLQVRERTWQPGARTPVHVISGPTSTYVLEGTIQRNTASDGVGCAAGGELYVSPVGELAQNTSVGSVAARTIDVDVWPAGEIRTAPQAPEVRVWHKSADAGTGEGGSCPAAEQ